MERESEKGDSPFHPENHPYFWRIAGTTWSLTQHPYADRFRVACLLNVTIINRAVKFFLKVSPKNLSLKIRSLNLLQIIIIIMIIIIIIILVL